MSRQRTARPLRLLLVVAAMASGGVGCRHRGDGAALRLPTGPAPVEARAPVIGPQRWVAEDGSLCALVPLGWVGTVGEGGAMLVLRHPSGLVAELLRGGSPDARPGFSPVFEDAGSYRDIPLLFPSSVVTWLAELPGGETIQEWTGEVANVGPVRFEVRYPEGHLVEGRQLLDEVMNGLCRP